MMKSLAAIVATLLLSVSASAANVRVDDLKIETETEWSGGEWGGYQPLRFRITNFGPPRVLEVRFTPYDRSAALPETSKRFTLQQNATANATLPIPLIGRYRSGNLSLYSDGRLVEGFEQGITLADADTVPWPVPSLLIIDNLAFDPGAFKLAALQLGIQESGQQSNPYSTSYSTLTLDSVDAQRVSTQLLPSQWLSYSAVDLVALRGQDFSRLPAEERAALLDWAATGGRLLLYPPLKPAGGADEVERLNIPAAAWTKADRKRGDAIRIAENLATVAEQQASGGGSYDMAVPNEGNPSGEAMTTSPAIATVEQTWKAADSPFRIARVGFGRVAIVNEDLRNANAADWAWLLAELGGPAVAWPLRHGMVSGGEDSEFLELPIRGVGGAPVWGFLTLVTLFSIGIGPVNYWLLSRQDKRSRLVLTVPAIAAVTTVLLLTYAVASHGFSTKGRLRTVTLLDPASGQAVSFGRLSLFSGLAPSDGLRFSQQTAVYPIFAPGDNPQTGQVDWTDEQTLRGGWLRSRTRTQFVTVTSRDERGRLVTAPAAGGLSVTNGLAYNLRYVVASGPNGKLYGGRDLQAGSKAVLPPLSNKLWDEIRTVASDRRPAIPEDLDVGQIQSRRSYVYGYNRGFDPAQSQGLLERHLNELTSSMPDPQQKPSDLGGQLYDQLQRDTVSPLMQPNGFLAVCLENPGVDVGKIEIDERDSLHLLIGRTVPTSR